MADELTIDAADYNVNGEGLCLYICSGHCLLFRDNGRYRQG